MQPKEITSSRISPRPYFFYLATCGSGIFVGSSAIPKRRFRSRKIVHLNLRLLRGKSLQSRVLRLRYLTADAFPVLLPDRSYFLPLFLKLRICSPQKKILPYPEKLYSVLLPTSKSTQKRCPGKLYFVGQPIPGRLLLSRA